MSTVQLPVSAAKQPPPSPISQTRLPPFLPCPHPPCSGAEEGSDEEMSSDEESLASEGEEESEYEAESDEEEGEALAEAGGPWRAACREVALGKGAAGWTCVGTRSVRAAAHGWLLDQSTPFPTHPPPPPASPPLHPSPTHPNPIPTCCRPGLGRAGGASSSRGPGEGLLRRGGGGVRAQAESQGRRRRRQEGAAVAPQGWPEWLGTSAAQHPQGGTQFSAA